MATFLRAAECDDGGVTVSLNHTFVYCRDQVRSSTFLAEVLGLAEPRRMGPFLVLDLGNDVSLDYHQVEGRPTIQHYAFLVSEDEFDQIFGRVRERGLDYWADPGLQRPGEINHNDGGRGVYFPDPDGHFLEIITRPYGG